MLEQLFEWLFISLNTWMSWNSNTPETMALTTTTTTTTTTSGFRFRGVRPKMIRIFLVLLLPLLISQNEGLKTNTFKSNKGFSRDEPPIIIQVFHFQITIEKNDISLLNVGRELIGIYSILSPFSNSFNTYI